MSKRRILFAAAVSLVVLSSAFTVAEDVVEAIVAIVNDDIITLSEYKAEHDMLYQILRAQLQGEEFEKEYKKQRDELLDKMITERLLLQEAEKKNINVDEQLKMMIENIKQQYSIASDEEFKRALAQQGVNYEFWRRQQERAFLQQAVVFSEVGRSIVIDETDVVNYYYQHPQEFTEPEEYKLRAIILFSENRNEEELKALMEEIDGKLETGEDMAALAAQYSEGPEKESGGDLGTFKRGELAEELQKAVDDLEPGELSDWIQMPAGRYLIKLEEKRESRLKSFEEVKKEIEEKLFSQAQQEKLQEYLEDLKKRSYIKILIPDPLNYR